ncbi:hypothetical protein DRO59_09440 [Candidatus Bathyarchaeota archaeon]|nr:MAG: hypothetical protein DRO59_09440 [Candidatus Bathyarchaeota archaeon]
MPILKFWKKSLFSEHSVQGGSEGRVSFLSLASRREDETARLFMSWKAWNWKNGFDKDVLQQLSDQTSALTF